MSQVTIAVGKDTKYRLDKEEESLKKSLNADKITFCENLDELKESINETDTLIVYSDFPIEYKEVRELAKDSKSVCNVIGMEYEDENKVWLYDGTTVANCITPKEEVPAIKRALIVPKTVNFIGQIAAAIIILSFVSGAVIYTHHQTLLASKKAEQTLKVQESEEIRAIN